MVLAKVASTMHLPQNTLREKYLGTISLLVEHDPATYARELQFDADQLNFFLNDKERSQAIVKAIALEEREREKEQQKKAKIKKPVAAVEEQPLPEPVLEPVAQPSQEKSAEKKSSSHNQSTLFDGF
jgi:replication factor C large subunit